jgi:hypothetical protein
MISAIVAIFLASAPLHLGFVKSKTLDIRVQSLYADIDIEPKAMEPVVSVHIFGGRRAKREVLKTEL